MKQFSKRLLSLLIVAVMVCTMLPMAAFAAYEITSVPLTLRISSYSAPFQNNTYTVTWLEYINKADVGSDNASGSVRAYFTKEGDKYWLTLDVKVGDYQKTVTHACNAYVDNKDMSQAGGETTFALSFNSSGGTSVPISISGGVDLAPSKPSDSVVSNLLNGKINVNCTNEEVEHNVAGYDLISGTYTIGDVQKVGNSYTSTVTVTSAQYVSAYNSTTAATHTPATENKSVTLTYSGSAWTLGDNGITFNVACTTPEDPELDPDPEPQAPTAPSENDVAKVLGNVKVYCGTVTTHEEKTYAAEADTITVGEVAGDADSGYSVAATITTAPYAAKYGEDHELDDAATKTVTLTWDADQEAWICSSAVSIKVKCEVASGETWTIKLKIVEISDDYNLGYNYDSEAASRTISVTTNVNQFEVTVPSFNTVANELGYTIKDGFGFVGISWDQTIDASSTINVPTTDTTSEIGDVYVTSNGYIIWYVVKEAEPQPPTVPTDDELKELLAESVTVDCINTELTHSSKTYGLLGEWSKTVSDDGKTITVTVPAQPYCDAYNADVEAGHSLVQRSASVTLTVNWDETAEKWIAGDAATVQVVCETPVPAAPTDTEVKAMFKVMVDCINKNKDHDTWRYDLVDGTYTIGDVTKNEGVFTSIITIKADKYIEKYNKDEAKNHSLAPSNPDFCIIPLTYTEHGWKVMYDGEEAQTPIFAIFEVICKNTTTSAYRGDLDDVPKTGDQSMLILGGCAAAIAMLAAAAMVLSKKKV